MTPAERLLLLLTADFLLLAHPPGYATLAQLRSALARLQAARDAVDAEAHGEAARVAALLRWPVEVAARTTLAPLQPEPWPVVERRAREVGL